MRAATAVRALAALASAGLVLAGSGPLQARQCSPIACYTTTVYECGDGCCDEGGYYATTVTEIQTVNVTNTYTEIVTSLSISTTTEISDVPVTTTATSTRTESFLTTITVSACSVTSAPARCCESDFCSDCETFSTPAGDSPGPETVVPSPTGGGESASSSPDPSPPAGPIVKMYRRQTIDCVISTSVVWMTTVVTDVETFTSILVDYENVTVVSTLTTTDVESVTGPTSLVRVTETDVSTLNLTATATQTEVFTSVEVVLSTVTQPASTVVESGPTVTAPGETVVESGPVVTVTEPGETIVESGSVVTVPGSTVTQPGETITVSGSVITVAGSTVIQPGTTVTRSGSVVTVVEPASTVTESPPGRTVTLTTTTVAPVVTCAAPTNPPGLAVTFDPKSDLTWGCKPGFVCSPAKPGSCNVWADAPADNFLCAASDCKPSPPFPVVTWPENGTGFYPPTDGYFNLDPEAFGLSFDIFQEELVVEEVDGKTTTVTTGNFASQTTITHFPPTPAAARRQAAPAAAPAPGLHRLSKRDASVVPALCYDTCNNCYLEAQQVGKTPALCDPSSAFEQYYQACQACIAANSPDVKATTKAYLQPRFQQFTTFCDVLDAQPALGPSSAPPQSQVNSGGGGGGGGGPTTSQVAQNTNTAPRPISTPAGGSGNSSPPPPGSTVSSALAATGAGSGSSSTRASTPTTSTPASATTSRPAAVTAGATAKSASSLAALLLPLMAAIFIL